MEATAEWTKEAQAPQSTKPVRVIGKEEEPGRRTETGIVMRGTTSTDSRESVVKETGTGNGSSAGAGVRADIS